MPVEIRELVIKATIIEDNNKNYSQTNNPESIDINKIISQVKEEIIDELSDTLIDKLKKKNIR